MDSATPIVPILIGDEMTTLAIASDLMDRGIFIFTAMSPAVPIGASRFRATITAAMEPDDIDFALTTLHEVGRSHGVVN